jgi:hypothetical protein
MISKLKISKIAIATLISAAAVPLLAQETKNTEGSLNPNDYKLNETPAPVAKLDKSIKPIDIKELTKILERKIGTPKGKFESDSEYRERVDSIVRSISIQGRTLEDVLPISVKLDDGFLPYESIKYKYDANKEELSLYALAKEKRLSGAILDGFINEIINSSFDVFEIERAINSESNYLGSNAFGATKKIKKYEATQYGIASAKVDWLYHVRERDYILNNPTARVINLANRAAKEVVPNLSVLILLKIKPPYIAYSHTWQKPTIELPVEMQTKGKYLIGDALGVIYYNKKNKEIIQRLPNE